MSDLYSALFNMIEVRNQHLQSLQVSEGVTGNLEMRTGNGEVIGEIHEGVLGQLNMTIGDETATITDNVMGGSKIDFGNGDVINSYENIHNGETFHSLTDVVGHTEPNALTGGIDFFNGNYEKIAQLSSPDAFGNMDFSYASIATDMSGFDLASQDWSTIGDSFNVDIDLDSSVDMLSEIFKLFSDWS
ncbi:hypothetical protein D3P07_19475 [Paenibacillus sp. 1011MAR3C5]|uniref:hypothetical protein n=1 Tax=Paenibacillus sp. 1011MAR3C5 TaxID=1675787 RepID=UPI000E6B57ED|nr:hypothetical protein [Paenibacillus sp. 1011MAR3C5]RJE86255.1 hypothetical protein D3P07_19475 [Paenibacillus sp. 1011MAR3C5]